MNENENTFETENPWVEVSLDDVIIYKTGEYEVFYRPDGKECVKVRRVQ